MKKPPLPNASNHVENGILVHLHVNVPLVASLVVEQIHRHIAAIAGQLADVLEVRLDQTVHHLLVSASLRRLARLRLRVQALHRLLRQQTTPHSPRAASLQEVLELLPQLQHLLHRHRVQVPLHAEGAHVATRQRRQRAVDRRLALLHGRVQQEVEDVQVGELIAALVLRGKAKQSAHDQLAHHLLVLVRLLFVQMRDGRERRDRERLLLAAFLAREQQERRYTSGGKGGATQLRIDGQLGDENAARVDGVVGRVCESGAQRKATQRVQQVQHLQRDVVARGADLRRQVERVQLRVTPLPYYYVLDAQLARQQDRLAQQQAHHLGLAALLQLLVVLLRHQPVALSLREATGATGSLLRRRLRVTPPDHAHLGDGLDHLRVHVHRLVVATPHAAPAPAHGHRLEPAVDHARDVLDADARLRHARRQHHLPKPAWRRLEHLALLRVRQAVIATPHAPSAGPQRHHPDLPVAQAQAAAPLDEDLLARLHLVLARQEDQDVASDRRVVNGDGRLRVSPPDLRHGRAALHVVRNGRGGIAIREDCVRKSHKTSTGYWRPWTVMMV